MAPLKHVRTVGIQCVKVVLWSMRRLVLRRSNERGQGDIVDSSPDVLRRGRNEKDFHILRILGEREK